LIVIITQRKPEKKTRDRTARLPRPYLQKRKRGKCTGRDHKASKEEIKIIKGRKT